MAQWDFKLTIVNNTDREIRLVDKQVFWGKYRAPSSEDIPPSGSQTYHFYSPTGQANGYQFSMTLIDDPPAGQSRYGTLTLEVDVPLSKDNKSSLSSTGILHFSGWDGTLPKRGHDFSRTIEISCPRL